MFRNCIVLLCCCVYYSGFAQKTTSELRLLEPDPFRLVNKFKRVTNLHSEKFIYLSKRKEYNFKEDTIYIAMYDQNGNEIEKVSYDYNKVKYTVKRKFNTKGKKIHATQTYRKRPKGVRHTFYTYTSYDMLKELKGYKIYNNDTTNHSFSAYKYEKNRPVSKNIYNGKNIISCQHFKHDAKGNLTYMHTGQKPESGTYIEYIYNDTSEITNKLEYVKYERDGEKDYLYKSKFMYNEDGKMIKDSVYSATKKHWTVTDYEYDQKGFLAKINIKRNDYYRNATFEYKNEKLQKMKVITNYNLTMKIHLFSSIYSAKMPATYEEFYTYDSKDRIKSTKIYINGELQAEYLRHITKL